MFDIVPQKTCGKCRKTFPATPEFWHKDKKGKYGLSATCKECAKAKSRQWHHENQEYANQRSSEWHASNLDKVAAYRTENAEKIAQQKREWRQNNPELVAASKKRHYEKYKTRINAYRKQWYLDNLERMREYNRIYALDHREEAKLRASLWYSNNKKRAAKTGAVRYQKNKEAIKQRVRDWARDNPVRAKNNAKASRSNRRARAIAAEGFFTADDVALAYRSQRGRCWHCGCHVDKDFHADHLISLKNGGTNWPNNLVVSCSDCNLRKGAKHCYQWNGKLF